MMDGVMPEVGQVPNFLLKTSTSLDLQMRTALNAKERRTQDWEALVKSAGERLVVKAIRQPPGSAAGLIEVVLN
jgi:6-hydroxytryprostatin B O-methyltransferase